jgi:hypothetical protein
VARSSASKVRRINSPSPSALGEGVRG